MEGWIRLHRQIKDHWIWKSQNRFQWWIDILLTVNHADTKVLIKGRLIECKRGQSVRSLESWARDWNVTKKTVKEFFELLQSDSMLVYEGVQITTRITVCNYDTYQDLVNTKETQSKRKVNAKETDTTPKQECKEGKECKECKEEEVSPAEPSIDFIDQIVNLFLSARRDYEIVNRGKERKASAKILSIYKNKYPEAKTEETLAGLKMYFEQCVNIQDQWLRDNMSPSLIVSKFNEINTILKNGKHTGNNRGITSTELADLVATKLGIPTQGQ